MIGETHVIFDLDGTLVDTAPVVVNLLNEMRLGRGMTPMSRNGLGSILSVGGIEMIKSALNIDANEASMELLKFRALYAQTHTKLDSVYPGVRKTLETLIEDSVCLSVCTNKPRNLAIKVLTETCLINYFRYISAGDDLPTKKPNIKNLEACLINTGYSWKRVYMVGDSTIDQALSRNARIPFWFFMGGYNDGVDLNEAARTFICYDQFPLQELCTHL